MIIDLIIGIFLASAFNVDAHTEKCATLYMLPEQSISGDGSLTTMEFYNIMCDDTAVQSYLKDIRTSNYLWIQN